MREVARLVLADTGAMKVKVDALLKVRGISRTKLAKLVDMDYRVVKRFCDGETSRYDVNLLCRICYSLECDLPDIVEYIPPKESNKK